MKLASWNVNSLKVRHEHVLDWLQAAQPAMLGLQETKTTDDKFPVEAIESAGYHVAYAGQPTYNGVAVIANAPLADIVTDPEGLDDPDRRVLAATIGDVRFINLYVVNGKAVGHEKYDYKLQWLERVTTFVAEEMQRFDKVAVVGDFNIAPDDRDVHDPPAWHEKILCSTPERKALQTLFDLGLVDTFRLHNDQDDQFSWWDYRAAAFRRKMGLRIDLILASKALSDRCTAAGIDIDPRKRERPSDHTPVWAEFDA